MAEKVATFPIELDTSGLVAPANQAAAALSELHAQIKADRAELRGMSAAMRDLEGASVQDVAATTRLSSAIVDQRTKIAAATVAIVSMGGSLDAAASKTAPAAKALDGATLRAVALKRSVDAVAPSFAGMGLQDVTAQLTRAKAAIPALEQAINNLGGAAASNSPELIRLRSTLDAQRATVSAAQSRFLTLGGNLNDLAPKAVAAKQSLGALGASAGLLPGPLGGVVAKLGAADALIKGGMVAGTLALAAAIVAVAVGASAAIVGLASYGVSLASARREETLHLEALAVSRSRIGASATSAAELQGAIDSVTSSTAVARGETLRLAESLHKGGLRGAQFKQALASAAVASAAAGSSIADDFAKQAIAANAAGRSVDGLASNIDQQYGKIAAARMLSLGYQSTRLKQNLASVFGGLNIEPLLKGLSSIVSMFDKAHAVGAALKVMFEGMFQPLINSAAGGTSFVVDAIYGVTIASLKLGIGIVQLRNGIRETFGDSTLGNWLEKNNVGMTIAKVTVYAFAGAVLLAGVAVAGLVISLATLAAPFIALGAVVVKSIKMITDINWTAIGTEIVNGVVLGVVSGFGKVQRAMRDLGDHAKAAFKSAMGIASPSRVMTFFGRMMSAGVSVGVDAGKPAVDRSVSNLVSVKRPQISVGVQAYAGTTRRSPAADRQRPTFSQAMPHALPGRRQAPEAIRDRPRFGQAMPHATPAPARAYSRPTRPTYRPPRPAARTFGAGLRAGGRVAAGVGVGFGVGLPRNAPPARGRPFGGIPQDRTIGPTIRVDAGDSATPAERNAARPPAPPQAPAISGGGRGPVTVTIGTLNVSCGPLSGDGAGQAAAVDVGAAVRAELVRELEKLGLQLGAG